MLLTSLIPEFQIAGQVPPIEVNCISRDNNDCNAGALFLFSGKSFDESNFIETAVKNGASAIVTDLDIRSLALPVVRVKNARTTYAFAWSAFCNDPQSDMNIYAITGTNGKTSTSYFLHRLLDYCGIRNAVVGTTGIIVGGEKIPFPPEDSGISQMTTPDPEVLYPLIRELKQQGIKHVVMEVSSHALALGKVDPIRFEASLFTNFSSEHLDFHKTEREYLQAKLRLEALSDKCIYNSDDLAFFEHFKLKRAVSYGTVKAHYTACCIRNNGVNGVSYLLRYNGAVMRIESPISGGFTVSNSLAAATLAIECGIQPETVCDAIASLDGIPGRLERLRLDKTKFPFDVMIDYAHTPEALQKLLESDVFAKRSGRLITLFGCGGDRDKGKRAVMGRIASQNSEMVYVTSDNPRTEDPMTIIDDILRGIDKEKNYKVIPDREEAIVNAFSECGRGDILLLVGKGHENYIVDRGGRKHFSEKEIIEKTAAGKYRKDVTNEL